MGNIQRKLLRRKFERLQEEQEDEHEEKDSDTHSTWSEPEETIFFVKKMACPPELKFRRNQCQTLHHAIDEAADLAQTGGFSQVEQVLRQQTEIIKEKQEEAEDAIKDCFENDLSPSLSAASMSFQ